MSKSWKNFKKDVKIIDKALKIEIIAYLTYILHMGQTLFCDITDVFLVVLGKVEPPDHKTIGSMSSFPRENFLLMKFKMAAISFSRKIFCLQLTQKEFIFFTIDTETLF